ncbi:MAG TPA: SRPBCC family protein [Acidimicrobiales bacterium]|nr:SRPBCC family protein [Acidimicrobiales bacterium]
MDDQVLPATGEVSVGVAVSPEALWPLVSDPAVPARFSDELVEAHFVDGDGPRVGAEIEGHNANGDVTWTTHSTVVECVEPTRFRWATGGADEPSATWSLEVEPAVGGATLTHRVVLHAGRAPLAPAIEAGPERAREIVDGRMAVVLENMQRVVTGIAGAAEAGTV